MIEIKIKLTQQDNSPAVAAEMEGNLSQATDNERQTAALIVGSFQLAMQLAGARNDVPLTCLDKDGNVVGPETPSRKIPVA